MADMRHTDSYGYAFWGGPGTRPGRPGWSVGPRRPGWGGPWARGLRSGGWWWRGQRWSPWGSYWGPYRRRRARWRAFGCCCPLMLLATLGTCAMLLTGTIAFARRRRAQ